MNYNRNKVRKIIDTVHYLIGKNNGTLNYTKMIKLLYLADKKALEKWGAPITGDQYYALKNGPVLSKTLDLIKGKADLESQTLWDEYFFTKDYKLIDEKPDRPYDYLSPVEIEILSEVDQKYKDYSWQQMIDLVHSPEVCPEWSDPGEGASPISIETILKKSGKTDKEIEEIMDEYYSNEEEKKFFLENCG
ncbi:MAG: Panacea domain-containing protein [Spirochaetaceae bacterium]